MKSNRDDERNSFWYSWNKDEILEFQSRRRPSPGKVSGTMRLAAHTPRVEDLYDDELSQSRRRKQSSAALVSPRKQSPRAAAAAVIDEFGGVFNTADTMRLPIQCKRSTRHPTSTESDIQVTDSGEPLPQEVRVKMETALSMDFSSVRVHVGPQAENIGALAFTRGTDIFFAPGQYQPHSRHGQELLGHELAHVVQQSAGRVVRSKAVSGVAVSDDLGLEKEADMLGARAAWGGSGENKTMSVPSPSASMPKIALRKEGDAAAESKMGLSVKSEEMQGTTSGFYTVRSWPSTGASGVILGKLQGDPVSVRVSGKAIGSGYVWYRIEILSEAEFTNLVASRQETLTASTDKTVKECLANQMGWVTADAVIANVTLAQFLRQLAGFEKQYETLTIKARITKLRQMAHKKELPFDKVIGVDSGSLYKDQRADVYNLYQILKDAGGVQLPSGEVVDMYHFLVGLDALQPDRMVETQTKWGKPIGSSYAAATWAGDIGSGAADKLQKHDEEYQKHFAKKGLKGNALERHETKHYFKKRAPTADLLGDLDSWAGVQKIPQASSLVSIIAQTYGTNAADSAATVDKTRKEAVSRFLGHYGFTATTGLKGQPAKASIQSEIFQFGIIWTLNRSIFGTDETKLWEESSVMADMFLDWLEGVATNHSVTTVKGTAALTAALARSQSTGSSPAKPQTVPDGFHSTFEIIARLPRTRSFDIGENGAVEVSISDSKFVRPDREGTSSDRFSLILWKDEAFDDYAAEVTFQVGKDGKVRWNNLQPGSYFIEIIKRTAETNPYETLSAAISVMPQ